MLVNCRFSASKVRLSSAPAPVTVCVTIRLARSSASRRSVRTRPAAMATSASSKTHVAAQTIALERLRPAFIER